MDPKGEIFLDEFGNPIPEKNFNNSDSDNFHSREEDEGKVLKNTKEILFEGRSHRNLAHLGW